MAAALRRIRVTLGLKTRNYPFLLVRAYSIYNAMLAHAALFPDASPTLAVLLTLVSSYDAAQQATTTRAKGSYATRNVRAALLIAGLESEQAYVQGLCDASPELAIELIAFAAMFVAGLPAHGKAFLEAKLTTTPGTVRVFANAKMLLEGSRKRPTFNWCYSINGGQTWVNGQSTPHADTLVAGLPLLTEVLFRVSVTLGAETWEWSQSVSLFVH